MYLHMTTKCRITIFNNALQSIYFKNILCNKTLCYCSVELERYTTQKIYIHHKNAYTYMPHLTSYIYTNKFILLINKTQKT